VSYLDFDKEHSAEYSGKIVFDPIAINDPHLKMFKPWWIIVSLGEENQFAEYYAWFYEKQHGIKLQRPAFGAHISVVRGEETEKENWENFKKSYNNKDITFTYNVSPRTNGQHVWLRVISEELKNLREQMGYSRDGKWGLHLTLGMPTPLYLERNYFVWRMYQKNI
jgi:hypothetical protein